MCIFMSIQFYHHLWNMYFLPPRLRDLFRNFIQSMFKLSSCPPSRPVLSNGCCLLTCSKTQFFDTASRSCQSCDSSCSSCSGAGPSNCLACSSSTAVLHGGTCVSANCNEDGTTTTATASVVPGLSVCLLDLVSVSESLAPISYR